MSSRNRLGQRQPKPSPLWLIPIIPIGICVVAGLFSEYLVSVR